MKCKNCLGTLTYIDGIYVCQSCGTKQQIENYYENTEVYICYIESDMYGRRTKDSVIAQDLYNKFQNSNINTFYQRISAEDLTDNDYDKACEFAFNKAKIIVLIGTNTDNFNRLLTENNFAQKRIFPVYSEMDAYDIPQEIAKMQSVNYNAIGSSSDLIKGILTSLGRGREVEINELRKKSLSKKKKIFTAVIGVITLAIILTGLYIVFGTPYILKSKKYDYAVKLDESGKYIEAIDLYSSLEGYKDSANKIKMIYNKYDGYYSTEDETYSLHLDINNNTASIEVINYVSFSKQISFSSESSMSHNLKYQFIDNLTNQGTCEIEFLDDGLKFILKTEQKNNDTTMLDIEYYFSRENKSDAPLIKKIDNEEILFWIKNGVSKSELELQGYEIQFLNQLGNGDAGDLCEIVNSDIQLEIYENQVVSLLVPAKIILPDRIGQRHPFILKDNILYIPNGILGMGVHSGGTLSEITEDTMIAVTSEALLIKAYETPIIWEWNLDYLYR